MKTMEFNKIEDALQYYTQKFPHKDITSSIFIAAALGNVGETSETLEKYCSILSESSIEIYHKSGRFKITDSRLTRCIHEYCEWRMLEPEYWEGSRLLKVFPSASIRAYL